MKNELATWQSNGTSYTTTLYIWDFPNIINSWNEILKKIQYYYTSKVMYDCSNDELQEQEMQMKTKTITNFLAF